MQQTAWDNAWDTVYETQGFRGKYPDEFVVRFIARNFFKLPLKKRKQIKIADLGCGPGRHVVFLANEGFSGYGIDGSAVALSLCKQKLKEERLKAYLKPGDLLDLPYPADFFDAAIDCASIEANRLKDAAQMVQEAHRVLKPNGVFLSIIRTDRDYANGRGIRVEEGTYTGYKDFDLKDIGRIHFFTEKEIAQIFGIFRRYRYEYLEWTIDNRTKRVTHWVVEAQK